jgi:hypothetical protein
MAVTLVTGDALLSLLGLEAEDERVKASLAQLAHGMLPDLEPEDDESLVDWVTVNELGLEYGFEDEAYVRALDPTKRRNGKLLLSQLYFYGDTRKTRPFPFALPFGLRFEDGKSETRAKFAEYESTRRSHIRDAWRLPKFDVIVAYDPKTGTLESVFCHVRYAPWPDVPGESELIAAFTPSAFTSLFGKRWSDKTLRAELAPLGYERTLPQIRAEHSADLRFEHGMELMFAPGGRIASANQQYPNALAFAGVTYYASRELDARQWCGALPCDLEFTDSQADLRVKMRVDAAKQDDGDRSGLATWKFSKVSVSVLYSNIENRILRVIMMARES